MAGCSRVWGSSVAVSGDGGRVFFDSPDALVPEDVN